ncbi:cysteine hydrolase [Thermoplasmatales archaeon AK]|nr:cysteine hydrolase [Thermoplasmatales archaeon AK]
MVKSILIIDLVNDFVTGKFGSERAVKVVSSTVKILEKVSVKVPVIFTLDTHIKNDPEFAVWGEHCLIGTRDSQLHPDLEKFPGYRITKRHYDAFFETDLEGYLKALNITELYVFGVSTDICVLHTVSGAFHRYLKTSVVEDLCAAINEERHKEAIDFMSRNYGARVISSAAMLEELGF